MLQIDTALYCTAGTLRPTGALTHVSADGIDPGTLGRVKCRSAHVKDSPQEIDKAGLWRSSRSTSSLRVIHNLSGVVIYSKALHGRLKSQRDRTGGKLTVDPPFPFRRERGTGKI